MFREIKPQEIKGNAIKDISEEWMLITAGNENGYNMMTASWGFVGEMWGVPAVTVAVRPQRYTMEFIDKNDYFTLSFYGDNKDIHKVCGYKSGRDINKTEECKLHPVFTENCTYFEEARLVILCKKRYMNRLNKDAFTCGDCKALYPSGDLHNMIIGEIVKVLINE